MIPQPLDKSYACATPQGEPESRGVAYYGGLYAKGLAMGVADVIPGVSGGTIAMVCGVYVQLVESIRMLLSRHILGVVRPGGFQRYIRAVRVDFLVALGMGIITALLLLSRLVVYLLQTEPVSVWSFFFGLILASVWFVAHQVKQWSVGRWAILLVGVCVGFGVSTAVPGSLPHTAFYYFLSGAIAICAMILPGISGSFVLVLLGQYESVLAALYQFQWHIILPFALGAIVGLLSFAHLLSWLLRRFYDSTVALLTGFMLGAIVRVWPWHREVGGHFTLLTPGDYAQLYGASEWYLALLFAVVGVGIVFLLERVSSRTSQGATM